MHTGSSWRIGRLAALPAIGTYLVALAACSSGSRNKSGTAATSSSQAGSRSQSPAATAGRHKTWGLHVKDQPGTVFHVEYAESTVIIDPQTVSQALRGFIFLFADSPPLRQKLTPGKIVLFDGLDLRKIDARAVDGPNLIVGTEPGPLREALKNWSILASISMSFTAWMAVVLVPVGLLIALGMFVFWLYLMYKAYGNRKFHIPFIGAIAAQQLG